jgi:hypothetical protein
MRFLKEKIQKSEKTTKAALIQVLKPEITKVLPRKKIGGKPTHKRSAKSEKRNRIPGHTYTKPETLKTKNIMKNYGRAICAFGQSSLALPYLEDLQSQYKFTIKEFSDLMQQFKDEIGSIQAFRERLVSAPQEDEKLKTLKIIFQKIGEIFMKYFSVNWVFTSRIGHKMEHIKYRFKILRRIQKPESFVYLK